MDRAPVAVGRGGTDEGPERLSALSDGVFAIAMTLLVLDVSVPRGLDDAAFHEALRQALPNVGAYALSFAVIANFWSDHRRVLGGVPRVDASVVGLTLLGLALIALLPFPTSLLAEYGYEPLAVAIYSGSVAATNAVHLALLRTSHKRLGPPPDPLTARVRRLDAADLGSSVVVFGVAVPLAFVSPNVAMFFWIILVPAKRVIGGKRRRATAAGGDGTF
ncbi:TMEM175 family protein [Wenjunlia tyrosinilytica]|uniref:TMEM175 family protein n=1 Tax=Wenjunlia tyrosinilytica TaxID=1544741 RepID=UPI001E46ED1E|nr:TMEM175 family protein [Wenjunlia tyrosinilytica]